MLIPLLKAIGIGLLFVAALGLIASIVLLVIGPAPR